MDGDNNRMQLAYRGVEGDEKIWGAAWKPQEGQHPRTSVLGNERFNSTHGPALCVTPHQKGVQMVWKGSGADQHIYIARGEGYEWGLPETVSGIGDYLTIDRPAIAGDQNGRNILVWRDPSNALLWSSLGRSSEWSVPGSIGATAIHGPALIVLHNIVNLFWAAGKTQETQNGQICRAHLVGNTWFLDGPVSMLEGAALTSDTPALVESNNRVFMAWKGFSDQHIWVSEWMGSDFWARPFFLIPSQGQGAILTSNGPALAALETGLCLVWKGEGGDQRIWISSSHTEDDGMLFSPPPPDAGIYGEWSTPAVLDPHINSIASPALVAYPVYNL